MKPINYLLTAIFLSSAYPISSQNITWQTYIDTSDAEIRNVIEVFTNYVHSSPDSLYDNPYWNESEKHEYTYFDFLEKEFQPSLFMGFPVHILSIKSKRGWYQIKAQFSYCGENGIPVVLCIVNYFARKDRNGDYKLWNALTLNRMNWEHTRSGYVDFYYPSYHRFDSLKAAKLNDFVIDICRNLDVEPFPFEYYMADDFDEIQQLRGIDYWMGMGGEIKPTGRSWYDKVYCSGMGENYFHEPYHILIDKYYPNKHYWISEGMATYLGGSRGRSMDWHIRRANNYLLEHPEINLNNMLELATIDQYTDYRYVLGGLICKNVYEKGGWEMIKDFMNSGKTDEDYYRAIEKYLGVKREDLDTYLRTELRRIAAEDKGDLNN